MLEKAIFYKHKSEVASYRLLIIGFRDPMCNHPVTLVQYLELAPVIPVIRVLTVKFTCAFFCKTFEIK